MDRTAREELKSNRFVELDSLRGAAALAVVFDHFKLLWDGRNFKMPAHLVLRILKLVSAGHEAVVLFFMLSGFVLCIPFLRGRPQPYPVFLTRRIFRIYLPYLAALILSVAADAAFHGYVPLGHWFQSTWTSPIGWKLVLQHVLFIGNYDTAQFNTAFWSLVVEMRISIVFPVLCLFVLSVSPKRSVVLAGLITLSCAVLIRLLSGMQETFSTLHYASIFIVGIFLARQRGEIENFYRTLSRPTKIVAFALSVLLYTYGDALVGSRAIVFDWPTILGASGLVIFSLNSEVIRIVLLVQPVRFLGEISYSLYLVHGTVLFSLVHLFYGRLSMIAIFPLYLSLAICLSTLFHHLVERPSMLWGRKVGNRLMPPQRDPALY